MRDLHQDRASLDYPIGGGQAVIDALIRGITKTGTGSLEYSAHVEEILVEDGRAVGVKLRRKGKIMKAKRAVISNASVWDTMKIIPSGKSFSLIINYLLLYYLYIRVSPAGIRGETEGNSNDGIICPPSLGHRCDRFTCRLREPLHRH
jgi:phytoene dehydrogenase-like protein